jgi:hypothetical protein
MVPHSVVTDKLYFSVIKILFYVAIFYAYKTFVCYVVTTLQFYIRD